MITTRVLAIICDECDRPLNISTHIAMAATFVYAEDARNAAQAAGWITDHDMSAFCPNCINGETRLRLTEHIVGPGNGLPTCIYCRQIVRDARSKPVEPLICAARTAQKQKELRR